MEVILSGGLLVRIGSSVDAHRVAAIVSAIEGARRAVTR